MLRELIGKDVIVMTQEFEYDGILENVGEESITVNDGKKWEVPIKEIVFISHHDTDITEECTKNTVKMQRRRNLIRLCVGEIAVIAVGVILGVLRYGL